MKYSNLTKNLNFTNTFLLLPPFSLKSLKTFHFSNFLKNANSINLFLWSKPFLKKKHKSNIKKNFLPQNFLIKSTVSCFVKTTKYKINLSYTCNNLVRLNKVNLFILPNYLKTINLFFTQVVNSNFKTYWLFKNFYSYLSNNVSINTFFIKTIKIKTLFYKNSFKNNIKNL